MTDPYSSTDQTSAMYAVLQQDIGQFLRLRRTNPSVELALLAVFAICFDHPKSSDNRIPRYGFSVTCWSTVLSRLYRQLINTITREQCRWVTWPGRQICVYTYQTCKQSVNRHVAPLWHTILILSQSVFALTPQFYVIVISGEAANINFVFFCLF
jgi:hypothetical protein